MTGLDREAADAGAEPRARSAGDPDTANGGTLAMELPFLLVPSEVFRSVGMAGREEAEEVAATWLKTMVYGSSRFDWTERGPGTAAAELDPDAAVCGVRRRTGIRELLGADSVPDGGPP